VGLPNYKKGRKMTSNNDPLKAILVTESKRQDRARKLLTEILKPFVEISEKDGKLGLLPTAYELSSLNLILVFLCGRLAQELLGKLPEGKNKKILQKEIIQALPTLSSGTIKASLSRLRDAHLVINDEQGNFVDFTRLQKIKARLSDKKSVTNN